MAETGKVSQSVFESLIASNLGADREDTQVGPQHGIDFGVINIGGQALTIATDPVSILPDLGFERAGRFAVRIILADVAVSGLSPSHLAISFSLPPTLSDEKFEMMWEAIHSECCALGVEIVTGHTARYAECSFPWVGAGTALAVGDFEMIIRPDGAKPGDDILITNGPAVEAAALFASLFPEVIGCNDDRLSRVDAMLDELDIVRDAQAVSDIAGVRAMHDITEGGLLGALHEMANGAELQFSVESDHIPMNTDVRAVCSELEMDPWRATSSGSMIMSVDPKSTEEVLTALRDRGTQAAVIGEVNSGAGVLRDGEYTEPPVGDSSWPVYETLLNATQDRS